MTMCCSRCRGTQICTYATAYRPIRSLIIVHFMAIVTTDNIIITTEH